MKEVRPEFSDTDDIQESTNSEQDDHRKKWKTCLELIENDIPLQTFQTWFIPISSVSFVDNVLTLRVPSRFVFEWLESHYSDILNKIIKDVFGEEVQVEYLVAPSQQDKLDINSLDENSKQDPTRSSKSPPRIEIFDTSYCRYINPHFTLGKFIVHKNNRMVKKAAEFVSSQFNTKEYNPLCCFGDIGTGKTHMLNAIGNNVRKQFPDKQIIYMSGEQYLHEYVMALQKQKINDFKEELASVDLLLLDDIHFLSGKMKSQECLVYVISQLLKNNRRLVTASNIAPNWLPQFSSRLISIFQNGLIVDLVIPEYNTREKIIRNYLTENGVRLSDDIIEFLSERFNTNMHTLNAVLVRLAAQISLLGNTINLNECRTIISQFTPEFQITNGRISRNSGITIDKIIREVGAFFNIPPDVIAGNSRYSRIVLARQLAMYLARKYTGESLSSIGYHFGDRNHTSVLYACNKIKQRFQDNPDLKNSIESIISNLM